MQRPKRMAMDQPDQSAEDRTDMFGPSRAPLAVIQQSWTISINPNQLFSNIVLKTARRGRG